MGEDLYFDPGLVHLLQAQCAKIIEPPLDLAGPGRLDAGEMRRHLGVPVVLFDSDDWTFQLVQHCRSPRGVASAPSVSTGTARRQARWSGLLSRHVLRILPRKDVQRP